MATSLHDSSTKCRSLWLHATWEAGSQVFEFAGGECRAIVVGSHRQSDIRVARPGFPPVAFCFERQGDLILVAPMASGGLRLNASRVIEPWPLVGGAVLEFGGARFDVTVLVRRPLEDDATTHSASAMTNTRDTEAMHATVEMAALDLDLESFPTEIMPQFHFWDQAPSDPIPPLPQRIVWPATAVGDLSVSTEDTTVFELESLEAPKSSPVSTGPPERDARERFLELDEAHRVGAPGSPSKRRAGSAGVTAWLARLGVSARERPLRVAMIGLGGALIAILVLVSIQTAAVSRRLPASAAVIEATVTPMPSAVPATRAPEVLLTASKPVPSAAAARVTADRPAPIAALRQVSSPVIRAATFAHSRSGLLPATRTDSDAVTALKYLVDGRDADALRAYSALATQSLENDAYQALVRLLRRRASQSCSGTPALSASCPEVKR